MNHQNQGASTAPGFNRSMPGRVRTAAKLAAVGLIALSAMVIPGASSASAATTPYCTATNDLYFVTGGCDGVGGPGHDRMDIQCWSDDGDYWIDWFGPWHNRLSSWQEDRVCGEGLYAAAVWFEHENT